MKANCSIISGAFQTNNRHVNSDAIITKSEKNIEIVYYQNDTLENFEMQLNQLCGNSSSLFVFKKKFITYFLSVLSVIVILFALISSALYEDIMKKIIFESPFEWSMNDTVSILFVLLFFFGLVLMPSILDGEGSQFKDALTSWFNKDTRVLKRLKMAFESLDKKTAIRLYNIDLQNDEHWIWRLLIPTLVNHFVDLEMYVRSDQKKLIAKRLKAFGCMNIELETQTNTAVSCSQCSLMFSSKEETLFTLMQLSSTDVLKKSSNQCFVSLELFEYCGRNFYDAKSEKSQLISGFQNFINRCFDDFYLLEQQQANQIYFSSNAQLKDLEDEKRRLSYYLRNHIEECIDYFDNPISLLILYYYVKDIVLDEKRTIAILEKLIITIKQKQQYDLISRYWFDIAGLMFDSTNLETFVSSNESIYRKLSIEALNSLIFLFERNGKFEQALLIAQYLYEINPNKYSIDICSLYERMGEFDNAYNSLSYTLCDNEKPTDVQVRYLQRKAWIIVSQRRLENKEEGEQTLNELGTLLFSHQECNEPLWLWHFYNIKANYEEWNENYDLAIENYMKCLSIPALGAFEYGATFVNMAIAYRFNFLTSNTHNLDIINQSIYLGEIGVDLKASVGDRDEMPVVLHNQALNILYKIAFDFDIHFIEKVLALTNEGIAILDVTNSKKRLGMMLIENLIAKTLLKQDTASLQERLQTHWLNMNDYEKEQAKRVYKLFCESHQLQSLEWMN